jgi:hypothetical protein
MRIIILAMVIVGLAVLSDQAAFARGPNGKGEQHGKTALSVQQLDSMLVTGEILQCGFECDLVDSCLGSDEELTWLAEGALEPGQTFTYQFPTDGSLCRSSRFIWAEAYKQSGAPGDLWIELDLQAFDAAGTTYHSEGSAVCLSATPSAPGVWSISVTNRGPTTERNIRFRGQNLTNFSQLCPVS